jgi:hypothetical protein
MRKKPYNKNTSTYNSWVGMKQRCLNPKNPKFSIYGNRGISVCDRWLKSFENFLEDMGNAPDRMSIERIDNNGNYEPKNCKWATNKEQSNNRRSNKLITYKGETLGVCEWSKRLGAGISLVTYRLKQGWNPISAITIKPDLGNKYNLNKIKC